MKKIVLIIAAALAVVAFSSCNKSEQKTEKATYEFTASPTFNGTDMNASFSSAFSDVKTTIKETCSTLVNAWKNDITKEEAIKYFDEASVAIEAIYATFDLGFGLLPDAKGTADVAVNFKLTSGNEIIKEYEGKHTFKK